MQLQRKIYWDQLKMLLFLCMCVKSQQNSQSICYWEVSIHYAFDFYAFCPYILFEELGQLVTILKWRMGNLTRSSLKFTIKKTVIFFQRIKKNKTKWSNICHSVVSNWDAELLYKINFKVNTFHAVKVLKKKSWVLVSKQAKMTLPL